MNHNFVLKAMQQSSNLKRRHKMQQKLLIYSELMNGKYHTLRDTVLPKLYNNFTRFVYKHGDGSRF